VSSEARGSGGSGEGQAVSPRADLLSATLWVAFGVAVVVGAWRMDRLAHLHINTFEVPGLVPGLLGAMLVLLGLLLAFRAIRNGALRTQPRPAPASSASALYMASVLGAMLLYSLVLVGHGLPFWLATAVFVSGFIFVFDRARQRALGRPASRQALLALACGVVTSAVVSLAFEHVFYVRLP
jgi:hypothetical protein